MEATVTISLKEQLKQAKEEAAKYENQKEFNIIFDFDIYDSKSHKRFKDYRVNTYGDLELLKQADTWKEYRELIKQHVDKIISESEILRFYNKFPKWIHRLFKC